MSNHFWLCLLVSPSRTNKTQDNGYRLGLAIIRAKPLMIFVQK
ncbi:hypothetical protein P4523_28410 [Bacillus toyonensis]|nr:hypothetical protein [Bacillus toyonensis]